MQITIKRLTIIQVQLNNIAVKPHLLANFSFTCKCPTDEGDLQVHCTA